MKKKNEANNKAKIFGCASRDGVTLYILSVARTSAVSHNSGRIRNFQTHRTLSLKSWAKLNYSTPSTLESSIRIGTHRDPVYLVSGFWDPKNMNMLHHKLHLPRNKRWPVLSGNLCWMFETLGVAINQVGSRMIAKDAFMNHQVLTWDLVISITFYDWILGGYFEHISR